MAKFEYEDSTKIGKLDDACGDILDLVGRITGKSGDLESLFNDAAVEFSDLIAEQVSSTATENATAWGESLTACHFAWGNLQDWKLRVKAYRSTIDDINQEWSDALADNFGFGTIDPADDSAGRLRTEADNAKQAKYEELKSRANKALNEMEESGEEINGRLTEGPTPANIRELIDSGILGWSAYNSSRNLAYEPVGKDLGQEYAEKLEPYWNGEKEPDEDYYYMMSIVSGVISQANGLRRDGEGYREHQVDFLESFFGELDGDISNISRDLDDVESLSGEEKEDVRSVLGGGILALSDEKIGGGYDRLPSEVREIAEGYHDYDTGAHPQNTPTDQTRYEAWESDAYELSRMLNNAPETGGVPMVGGKTFSAHMTTTVGDAIGRIDQGDLEASEQPQDRRPGFDGEGVLEDLLGVSSRNEEANHMVLTGKTSYDGAYGADGLPDYEHPNVEEPATVANILAHDWPDGGKAAAGLIDWIPDAAADDDPDRRQMAGHSALGLIDSTTGDKEYEVIVERNDDALGANPHVADSMADVFTTYIVDFGRDEIDGEPAFMTDQEDIELSGEHGEILRVPMDQRIRFMELIATDQDAAVKMNGAVNATDAAMLDLYLNDDEVGRNVAGSVAGNLRGLKDAAVYNGSLLTEDDGGQAEDRVHEIWKLGWQATSDVTIGNIPFVGSGLSTVVKSFSDSYWDSLQPGPYSYDAIVQDKGSTEGGEKSELDFTNTGDTYVRARVNLMIAADLEARGADVDLPEEMYTPSGELKIHPEMYGNELNQTMDDVERSIDDAGAWETSDRYIEKYGGSYRDTLGYRSNSKEDLLHHRGMKTKEDE